MIPSKENIEENERLFKKGQLLAQQERKIKELEAKIAELENEKKLVEILEDAYLINNKTIDSLTLERLAQAAIDAVCEVINSWYDKNRLETYAGIVVCLRQAIREELL